MAALNQDTIIGVCGAGSMGAGIAQVAAQAGHDVIVYDSFDGALEAGRSRVAKGAAALLKRGKIDANEADAMQARIMWADNIGALKPCGLIIEAIIENREIKTELFKQLEAITDDNTLLATNTSSLSVSSLAAPLKRPENFLGLHFFNPAPIMKLVEVISGLTSAQEAVQSSFDLMENWGKQAVMAKDVPGFIVNRIARPFYSEGWRAYEEGAASAAEIDYLYRDLAGFRMGPLELGDLIGHDINSKAARSIYDAYYGRTRFLPSLTQQALAESGLLGRKTGRGVYNYAEGAAKEAPNFADEASFGNITCGPDVSFADDLEAMKFDAEIPNGFCKIDGVLIGFANGFSAGYLKDKYNAPVALLDWTADLKAVSILAYNVSSHAADTAARGFITVLGKKGIRTEDRPGGIVLRTLLQLANAASDALRDKVADEAALDKAMRFGVNYPFGPMAWARDYGLDKVVNALKAIAEETGQYDLYSPNETLQALARDANIKE